MEFTVTVVTLKGRPNLIPLRQVWNIDNIELSPNGSNSLERLESSAKPMQAIYRYVCWQGQALLEFQDLQEMPKKGFSSARSVEDRTSFSYDEHGMEDRAFPGGV